VLRSAGGHRCALGNHILIGPNAHVVGATIEDEVLVATGAAVFHGSHLGKGSEVRINGIVHLKTRLKPGACVPIGWIACGDPAQLFSPDRHDALWVVQESLNFPLTVYGIDWSTPDLMKHITESLSARLGGHLGDKIIG
jgi:carbonic anhydrase/acetyltransferase-like protein (isoleucine patch superfamily)